MSYAKKLTYLFALLSGIVQEKASNPCLLVTAGTLAGNNVFCWLFK